jgi:hypothetical protein
MHLPKFIQVFGVAFRLENGKYYRDLEHYHLGFKRTRNMLVTTGFKIHQDHREYEKTAKGFPLMAISEREYNINNCLEEV